MSPFEILISVGLVVTICVLLWKKQSPTGDSVQLKERVGELQAKLESETSEKNRLVGQNKQMYAENVGVKEEVKSLKKDVDALQKKVTRFEADEQKNDERMTTKIQQLDAAKDALEDERNRVRKEDDARRQKTEEERDRIWAEHENNVIAQLTTLCKSPQLAFGHYSNTNLPDDFDGSLKPDFMIDFLDQYIIFDAKKSKQESLQTYINNAIKNTVQKVKKNPKIAPMIYLVVPTEAISELRTFVYPLDGYTIYVVSPESLPPILASLKKITTYEFADQMDPQQRENIVQIIAELDFHINLRNAADIILTKQGAQILAKVQGLEPEIANDVAMKKQPMNAKASIAASEIKKIVSNLTAQNMEVQQLVSPTTAVKKKDLKAAEAIIVDSVL